MFDTFHILDRKKLADEFVKHQELLENKKFFVQVNLGMEDTKSGISPEKCNDFIVNNLNKKITETFNNL